MGVIVWVQMRKRLMGIGKLQILLLLFVLLLRELRVVPLLVQYTFPRRVLFLATPMRQRGVKS